LFCIAAKGEVKADASQSACLYPGLPTGPRDPDSPERRGKETMGKEGIRISLVHVNLVAEDAIGTCIINQVRLFRRRGDDVHVYVRHPPSGIPPDVEEVTSVVSLGDLISGQREHFDLSDLYVYHYPSRHELMESIRGIDRGTVIFYFHNVTPPILWGSDTGRETLMRSLEGRALAHYADLCITPSPFNKQDLVNEVGVDPERIHVLPLAVPLGRFVPGEKDPGLVQRYNLEGSQVMLFVGRMAGNKRIDLLIEALARVRSKIPDTKLLLVGDDRGAVAYREIVAAARARADELGIADCVIWTGPVDELPPYYRLADVYVTASLHEGFGVPLIEAMACGVPVVASRVGAMPWVVEDAGLLFEPGNADELAQRVVQVLEDAGVRQSLAERGLERAQAFSLEGYEASLTELVDKAVTYTLPKAPPAPPESVSGQEGVQMGIPARHDVRLLRLLSDEIAGKSDISLDGYTVRSKVPVLGPLIAWVRRNLTSHLREPYLDPIVGRQVDYNVAAAQWVKRAATAIATQSERQAELEARVEALEEQVEALGHAVVGDEAEEEG
jgi:glycosyltransferase involved in cell wall biosynthesis